MLNLLEGQVLNTPYRANIVLDMGMEIQKIAKEQNSILIITILK
jgi:hypothetical protein